MRPKVIVGVLVMALLLLGTFLLLRLRTAGPQPPVSSQVTEQALNVGTGGSHSKPIAVEKNNSGNTNIEVNSVVVREDSATQNHKAYVESRTGELLEMAMTDDPASLNTILSELTNRDPEIRKAAVEATLQFGSRDAIPKLTEVASQTDDPKEKAEIVEAIEFLKLPSLTEVIAEKGGVRKPVPKTAGVKPLRPKSKSP